MLVASPSYGLSGRLRLIASARVMARALGKRLVVLWRHDRDIPTATWADLFEPGPDPIDVRPFHALDRVRYALWRAPVLGSARLHALGGVAGDRTAAHERLAAFTTLENTPCGCVRPGQTKPCSVRAECSVRVDPAWRNVGLRGQYNYKLATMADDEYVARMHAFYQALRPGRVVRELVDEHARRFSPSTVGVHVRQTDARHYFVDGAIPVDLFAEAMAEALRRDPAATFFVCSEDPAARDRLSARFGDRILPRTVGPAADERYTTFGQQAALADLILLSRTRRLLGSRFSGFTYAAAAWGGIPLVEVGGELAVRPET